MIFKKICVVGTKPKAIIVKLFFFGFWSIFYVIVLHFPSAIPTIMQHQQLDVQSAKMEYMIEIRSALQDRDLVKNEVKDDTALFKREIFPSFLSEIGEGTRIGVVNMENEDTSKWKTNGKIVPISFKKVSNALKWDELFPEWIDEEEEFHRPSCPKIPMPKYKNYKHLDMIVAKLPCEIWDKGLKNRDVFRLQVHLVVANLAVRRGERDHNGNMRVVFVSECRPMVELFRCDDLVKREGKWWYYKPEIERLELKVSMAVGSCQLALPLWDKELNELRDVSKVKGIINTKRTRREAYATILHSSEDYVCGAITLAQSLLHTGTQRDLILLLDNSISKANRRALSWAGWKLRFIKRIRNPNAKENTYNEYNYSKFRLWQLTDYVKIIFIDSDIIVLRNLDILFYFPEMSAKGNDGYIFNSGIMVIEPSNCTFNMFMQHSKEVISYNGGDQGFLNEIFAWWHRLPRKVNFLKNYSSKEDVMLKNKLLVSDPPKLYSIHYLGKKPWLCYRDYDCNFNIPNLRLYANDVAHARWWKVHDAMDERLQKACRLSNRRMVQLNFERDNAQELGLEDQHWRINITDSRTFI